MQRVRSEHSRPDTGRHTNRLQRTFLLMKCSLTDGNIITDDFVIRNFVYKNLANNLSLDGIREQNGHSAPQKKVLLMTKINQTLRKTGIIISLLVLTLIISAHGSSCYADMMASASSTDSGNEIISGEDAIQRGSNRGDFYLSTYGVTSDYPLHYESADESIVTVNEDGYVQMHSAGETVIRVTTDDPEAVKLIDISILKRERPTVQLRYCSDYEGDLTGSELVDIELLASAGRENSAFTDAYLALEDSSINAWITPDDDYIRIDNSGVIKFDRTFLDELDENIYAGLTITTEETDLYQQTSFYFYLTLLRKERVLYFEEPEISAIMRDGGYQLQLVSDPPYEQVRFASSDDNVATVDSSGYVTFHNAGDATIYALVPWTRDYREREVTASLHVTESRQKQYIQNVPKDGEYVFTYAPGEGVNLGLSAYTPLTYESNHPEIATVDSDGTMHFTQPGAILLTVEAAASNLYFDAGRIIVVKAEDPAVVAAREEEARLKAEEEARLKAEEEARLKAEEEERLRAEAAAAAAEAQNRMAAAAALQKAANDQAEAAKIAASLKRPKLKCIRKKRKNKLSWNKINGASGYELYVKYPGSKFFVKVLNKSSMTKSVLHRGLTKGKVYKYKIRPYVQKGNSIAYGKFSKVAKGKVK